MRLALVRFLSQLGSPAVGDTQSQEYTPMDRNLGPLVFRPKLQNHSLAQSGPDSKGHSLLRYLGSIIGGDYTPYRISPSWPCKARVSQARDWSRGRCFVSELRDTSELSCEE